MDVLQYPNQPLLEHTYTYTFCFYLCDYWNFCNYIICLFLPLHNPERPIQKNHLWDQDMFRAAWEFWRNIGDCLEFLLSYFFCSSALFIQSSILQFFNHFLYWNLVKYLCLNLLTHKPITDHFCMFGRFRLPCPFLNIFTSSFLCPVFYFGFWMRVLEKPQWPEHVLVLCKGSEFCKRKVGV